MGFEESFRLSISSQIDFEGHGAVFFFTRTDLIGAWTSGTSWKRVLKTLTLSQHHQTDHATIMLVGSFHVPLELLFCKPSHVTPHPFSAVSYIHATINCAEDCACVCSNSVSHGQDRPIQFIYTYIRNGNGRQVSHHS